MAARREVARIEARGEVAGIAGCRDLIRSRDREGAAQAADQPGSRNLIGIKNPAVDAMINEIIFAKNRSDLEAVTKALDRILLNNVLARRMTHSSRSPLIQKFLMSHSTDDANSRLKIETISSRCSIKRRLSPRWASVYGLP
jgi:hypothetical protein